MHRKWNWKDVLHLPKVKFYAEIKIENQKNQKIAKAKTEKLEFKLRRNSTFQDLWSTCATPELPTVDWCAKIPFILVFAGVLQLPNISKSSSVITKLEFPQFPNVLYKKPGVFGCCKVKLIDPTSLFSFGFSVWATLQAVGACLSYSIDDGVAHIFSCLWKTLTFDELRSGRKSVEGQH